MTDQEQLCCGFQVLGNLVCSRRRRGSRPRHSGLKCLALFSMRREAEHVWCCQKDGGKKLLPSHWKLCAEKAGGAHGEERLWI
jgi:hypothetical protein